MLSKLSYDHLWSNSVDCLDELADFLPSLPASAIARIGETVVTCGVRPVVCRPSASTPTAGIVDVTVQISSTSDPELAPSMPGGGRYPAQALELADSLSKVFSTGDLIDLEHLVLLPGKAVWSVRCEITVVADDGAALEACVAATSAALQGCPLIAPAAIASAVAAGSETGTAVVKTGATVSKVRLSATPVGISQAVLPGRSSANIVVDATAFEEAHATGRQCCVVAVRATEEPLVLLASGVGGGMSISRLAAHPAVRERWSVSQVV